MATANGVEGEGDARALVPERLRGMAIALVAAGFLAVAGAFGTAEVPIWARFAYWTPMMVLGSAWGGFCSRRIYRDGDRGRPIASAVLLTTAIAVPLTAVVWAATSILFGRALSISTLPAFLGPVFVVSAAMTGISILASRAATPVDAPAAKPVKFLERLPLRLRGAEIWAVEAEDHYLRVRTDRGSDLILMRLSDAVDELEGLEGARTHRSWWVAKSAVTDVARGDGRAVLTLRDGTRVPVSRTHARALRAAGWF